MRLPRVRFTVLSMMVAVMISALVVNWFRPVTQTEAEKIAEARLLKISGASRWVGRYRVHALSAGSKHEGDMWIVDFTESGDGTFLAQIIVASKGKIHAIGLDPGRFK